MKYLSAVAVSWIILSCSQIAMTQTLLINDPPPRAQAAIAAEELGARPAPSAGDGERTVIEGERFVLVEAEGHGATKLEAMTAAWIDAVRQGVGLYLDSRTEVVDEDILEQIVAHSRGRVNSYDELSAENVDGLWRVTILAEIEKDILQETAATAATTSVNVDGGQWGRQADQRRAGITTDSQRKQSAQELLEAFGKRLKFEDSFTLTINPVYKDGAIVVQGFLSMNQNIYRDLFLNDFVKILEQIAIRKHEKIYHESVVKVNKEFEDKHCNRAMNPIPYRGETSYSSDYISVSIPINSVVYHVYEVDGSMEGSLKSLFSPLERSRKAKIFIEAYAGEKLLDLSGGELNIGRSFLYTMMISGYPRRLDIVPIPFISGGFCNQIEFKEITLNVSEDDLATITEIKGRYSIE